MKKKCPGLLWKRMRAYAIDLALIISYAAVLFLLVSLITSIWGLKLPRNPVTSQIIGFIALTLPVILASYWLESGTWKGTPGKRMLKLIVVSEKKSASSAILYRNILKYLPWEIAHTGVHRAVHYSSEGFEIPIWVWIILILPQIMVIVYLVSLIISKGNSTVYDKIAGTAVMESG